MFVNIGEFEKELQKQQRQGQNTEADGFSSDISNMLSTSGSEPSPIGANYSRCSESPLGMNEFIQEFIAKNYGKTLILHYCTLAFYIVAYFTRVRVF